MDTGTIPIVVFSGLLQCHWMKSTITVSSSMLIPAAKSMRLKPAQVAIIWEVAHELDRRRIPSNITDAVWLKIPSNRLRNPEGRTDNHYLKKCLDGLLGVKLEGELKGDPWGANLIAEYQIKERGAIVHLLIPPAGVRAVLAPKTFAKIESEAKYRLKGAAKLLYAALADKKHMGRPYWVFDLDELRHICNMAERYPDWNDFNRYVLKPALKEIEDFGTVNLTVTPQKEGRSIATVRFDWQWKTLDEATETDTANDGHSASRRKEQATDEAPPLTDAMAARNKAYAEYKERNPGETYSQFLTWWKAQSSDQDNEDTARAAASKS